MKKLKAEKVEELTVFVLVTMAKKLEDVTVNLQGPLLFNLKKRLCLQIIIPEGKYATRYPLFGDELTKNKPESSSQEKPVSNESSE